MIRKSSLVSTPTDRMSNKMSGIGCLTSQLTIFQSYM